MNYIRLKKNTLCVDVHIFSCWLPHILQHALEAFEMCIQAGGTGKAVMLMGQLSNEAARSRSEDVREVVKLSMCNGIEIIEEQTANWSRVEANDLMTNWLTAGLEFNIVFANNDEMAIGAIQALKSAGVSMDDVIIGGVDATEDALNAMMAGDLDVTVFQNAAAQGAGAVDAADWTEFTLPSWIDSILEGFRRPNAVLGLGPIALVKGLREIPTILLMNLAFSRGLMQFGVFRTRG